MIGVFPGGRVYNLDPATFLKGGTTYIDVPTGYCMTVLWIDLRYVCSADVANRAPSIQVRWTNLSTTMNIASGTLTASQTGHISYGLVSGEGGTIISTGADNGPGYPLVLYQGMRLLFTVASGEQAADTWTAAGVVVFTPLLTP